MQPAFLLGHGPRGASAATRTKALLRFEDRVRLIDSPATIEAELETLAPTVPGGTLFRVIHLIDVDHDDLRAGLASAAVAARNALRPYPALQFEQFVVALVDRDWDDDERDVLLGLGDEVGAVLVISRSNEAAVQLTRVEEECMASDMAHALICSDLSGKVRDERFWLVGTSAIYYRRRAIIEALVAFHVHRFLVDRLLSPLPANHTECAEAQGWIKGLLLGRGEHLTALERSPTGSSVVTEIKLDEKLFREVAPEFLLDTLRSYALQIAEQKLGKAREQIERNQSEHLGVLEERLRESTTAILNRSLRLASALEYAECARDALTEPLREVGVALSEAAAEAEEQDEEQENLEAQLERAIRSLPFPIAVTARCLGFGALGIGLYHLAAVLFGLDANLAVLGLGIGLVFAIPLALQYAGQRATIGALRERYLTLVERRIRGRALIAVLEAAVEEIQRLQQFAATGADSLTGRLKAMTESLSELARRHANQIATRESGPLVSTRLSMLVPTVKDMSTDALADEYPLPVTLDPQAVMMRCLLADRGIAPVDIDRLAEELNKALLPHLEPLVPRNLADQLKQSESTERTARHVLGASTAPVVRRSELVTDSTGVRRLATVAHDAPPALADLLRRTAVHGSLGTDDSNSAVQIAIRPVPDRMRRLGGP